MKVSLAIGLWLLTAATASAADRGRAHAPPPRSDESQRAAPSDDHGLRVIPYDEPFQLALGERIRVEHSETLARFAELVEDSRCPTGARCLQAGRVRVRLEVTREETATVSIELGSDGDARVRSAGGVTWELRSVEPAPAVGGSEHPDLALTLVAHPLRRR